MECLHAFYRAEGISRYLMHSDDGAYCLITSIDKPVIIHPGVVHLLPPCNDGLLTTNLCLFWQDCRRLKLVCGIDDGCSTGLYLATSLPNNVAELKSGQLVINEQRYRLTMRMI
jgi:hypothetical protein